MIWKWVRENTSRTIGAIYSKYITRFHRVNGRSQIDDDKGQSANTSEMLTHTPELITLFASALKAATFSSGLQLCVQSRIICF